MTYMIVAEYAEDGSILAYAEASAADEAATKATMLKSEGYANAFACEMPSPYIDTAARVKGGQVVIDQAVAAQIVDDLRKSVIIEQMAALERLRTPRRMAEAVLGEDTGWLADNVAQIAALRSQL